MPHFKEKNDLSIALAFRTVVNTADINQAPTSLNKEDMKHVEVVQSTLKSLFKLNIISELYLRTSQQLSFCKRGMMYDTPIDNLIPT